MRLEFRLVFYTRSLTPSCCLVSRVFTVFFFCCEGNLEGGIMHHAFTGWMKALCVLMRTESVLIPKNGIKQGPAADALTVVTYD